MRKNLSQYDMYIHDYMLDSSVGQQEGVLTFMQPTPRCETQASPDRPCA